jgi:hypothetical protein
MALITRASTAHIDATTAMKAPQLSGDYIAGEALDAVAPCYIKEVVDGKMMVYMSNGTAADAAAAVDGFTPVAYAEGEPVTLYGPGTRFGYGTGLTAPTALFLGETAGRLDDGATTGGEVAIAKIISPTDIVVRALVA